jgi:alkylation response protein AidB-like acyl-CoA dehydrogenase
MDFAFTNEQQLLRDTLQRFCRDSYTFEQRQRILSCAAADAGHWEALAGLGMLALPFSQEDGGLGGNMIDVMVVMEEFGRALVIEPYLASVVLAGGVLKRIPDARRRAALLSPLMDGRKKYALAHAEADSRYSLTDIALAARRENDHYVLSGEKIVVLGGGAADCFIVSANLDGRRGAPTLFLVEADAAGLRKNCYRTVDGFDAADVVFDDVRVDSSAILGEVGKGIDLLEPAVDDALVALGAEGVGAMAFVNAATIDYAKTRKQFGVSIASFQVLQHRMVDMFIEREQTVSILYKAAMLSATGGKEAGKAASALKIQLSKACRFVGQQTVQLHGGMGIAEESAVAHYFKRLSVIGQQFGNADFHAARYARLDHSDSR